MKTQVSFVTDELPTLKRRKIKSILDLGCGLGRPSIFLAKSGFDVVGIDISKSALRIANAWAQKENLRNVELICGTMTHLPFRNDCFGGVVSVSTIIHAVKKDILSAVSEIYRTLNKNGMLLTNLTSTRDPRYGKGEKIEDNTFRILEAFEEKQFEELHHFFTKQEALEMFAGFTKARVELLNERPYYWKVVTVK
jgi:ubiquinone/menaquinone biosynthesis C-methylase UbiE